jgi:prepilin-type N-terminal cleavage/methylation domain-containing protein
MAVMFSKRCHGFTLVELLVSASILGCLMGLVLPAVHGARDAARNAECKNNLHQIGIEINARVYARGRIPLVLTGNAQYKLLCPVAVAYLDEDSQWQAQYRQVRYGQTHIYYTEQLGMSLSEIVAAEDTVAVHDGVPQRTAVRYAVYLDDHVGVVVPPPPAPTPPDEPEDEGE